MRTRKTQRSEMENCYKMYEWVSRTLVALMLQMFWRMRQISEYFGQPESDEALCKVLPLPELKYLTAEYKHRRHIRSMSDVQRSTPYHKVEPKIRRISQPTIYDSDSRTRRVKHRQRYRIDSSDSSSDSEYRRRTNVLVKRNKNSQRNCEVFVKYKASSETLRYM